MQELVEGLSDKELTDLTRKALGCTEQCEVWRPLEMNSDAMWLAIELRLHVDPNEECSIVFDHAGNKCEMYQVDGEPHTATCRAIVLAAAARGLMVGSNEKS